jgi:ADP-ribose pyrophosphatase
MTMQPIVPREIKTVYRGRVFTVQIETITLPKGGELQAEIIRHPGSVVIVPVTDAGEIVLVQQYRPAIGRLAWELPAGSLKPGEDIERAAIPPRSVSVTRRSD